MRFRTRVLLALLVAAALPVIGIAIGVRREMDRRVTAQYDARAVALAGVVRDQLALESSSIAARLTALREAMLDDNRLRLALGQRDPSQRTYLLDYAGQAMQLTGLSMLQVQDDDGRIVSSGHFRNEFDRLEPDLPALLAAAPGGAALVDARTPDGPLRVIARVDSLRVNNRRLTLVGGIAVDPTFLRVLAPDSALTVTLTTDVAAGRGTAADSSSSSDTLVTNADRVMVSALPFPFIAAGVSVATATPRSLRMARFVVTRSDAELRALTHSVDQWFVAALLVGIAVALIAAAWLASQVSFPLRELAARSSRIDLERLDVTFASDRSDEVGDLSRMLDAMTRRLRTSAARERDAERRATVGDLARQITHDMKNGLVPIRHVLRHLTQVEREDPQLVAAVFAERRPTLNASVEYLDALARNYARLSRPATRERCGLNDIAREAAARAATEERVAVRLELDPRVPIVSADPLMVRRIVDNLVRNAIDAVAPTGGTVTVATESTKSSGVRVVITDNGPGMTQAELKRAFEDFHTTKPQGMGLGLSIVRRLVADVGASLDVQTAPGQGTTVTVGFDEARG